MKRHQNLLMLLAICSLSIKLSAQRFYVTTGNQISKVNLTKSGCSYSAISGCPGGYFFSITLFKDKLYYVQGGELYQSRLVDGKSVDCKMIEKQNNADPTALTVDSKGVLYFAISNILYTYDPDTKVFKDLGFMPYSSAGDLVFFEGSLYMASTQGIVLVDTSDVSKSSLEIPMSGALYGLASLSTDCNANKIFAFSSARNNSTDVIELDMVNKKEAGVVCTLPFEVLDAASDVENGSFLGIQLNSIETRPLCDKPPLGEIKIFAEPSMTSYFYSFDGSPATEVGIFTAVRPGTHSLRVTTPGGCVKDTILHVPFYNSSWPKVEGFKEDVSCEKGGRVWFTMPANDPGYWIGFDKDTFAMKHIFSGLRQGAYAFKIYDQFNCPVDSMKMQLSQDAVCDTIYFPNAFTPNGDNKNDVFRGGQNFSIASYSLTVYDRWGQLVYKTNDLSKGWNGKRDGKDQPIGVYVWTSTYTTSGGKTKTQKGTVALLR